MGGKMVVLLFQVGLRLSRRTAGRTIAASLRQERDLTVTSTVISPLSSATTGRTSFSTAASEETSDQKSHRQEFVTTPIEPQEWDDDRKDPLHRPKYRSRARILSKHDYNRLQGVTFEDRYETFEDAMVTLSWMDHKTKERIYKNYLNWMMETQKKFGKTSHEYVCRLIAQKFRITPHRAAAIIQLQHSEEQYKIHEPERELLTEQAAYIDECMKHTIEQAYRSTGEVAPETFVERASYGKEDRNVMEVEDLFDVQQLTNDANVREQERARLLINDHVYVEDIDDSEIEIPLCKDAKTLIKVKGQEDPPPSPPTTGGAQPSSKAGWKFVAQIIDTREFNPKIKRSQKTRDGKILRGKRYRNRFQYNWPESTLIEENGSLRAANLAEVKQTSWKPVRQTQEFTYAEAKKGWLDRTVRGDMSAWGRKPVYEGTEASSEENDDDDMKKAAGVSPESDEIEEDVSFYGDDEDTGDLETTSDFDSKDDLALASEDEPGSESDAGAIPGSGEERNGVNEVSDDEKKDDDEK